MALAAAGRIVTVVASDLDGLQDVRALEGDAVAERAVADLRVLVTEHLRGALALKWLGASAVAAYATPADAALAATALQRAALRSPLATAGRRLRVGVATGEARLDGELFGDAVAAAVRAARAADAGCVIVDDVTRQLCRQLPDVVFEPVVSSDDGALHQARAVPRGLPVAELLAARPPFVGRTAERSRLSRALRDVAGGRGRTVLVLGEAGIGKTRLTDEFADGAAEHGVLVVRGRCPEHRDRPYAAIADLALDAHQQLGAAFGKALGAHAPDLVRVVPELAPLLPGIDAPVELTGDQLRRNALAAAARAVAALANETGPMMLFVDDLHWAGEATLLLLEEIAAVQDAPVLLVATARDTADEIDHLGPTLERLRRRRLADIVELKGLNETEVRELARGIIGADPPALLTGRLASLTGGNALFVEETLWHAAATGALFDDAGHVLAELDDVPAAGAQSLIEQRLARVDSATLDVLRVAAVIGEDVEVALLHAVVGDDGVVERSLERAAALRVLVPANDERTFVRFVHGLTRHGVLAMMTAAETGAVHWRIAQRCIDGSLELSPTARRAAAHHLLAANRPEARPLAVDVLLRAADDDLVAAAYESAIRNLEHAERLGPLGPSDAARLQRIMGSALRGLGDSEGCIERWRAALDHHLAAGETDAYAELSWQLAHDLGWLDRYREAGEVIREALDHIGERAPGSRALLESMSAVLETTTDPAAAAETLAGALARAEELADPRVLAYVARNASYYHDRLRDRDRAIEWAERAVGYFRAYSSPWEMASLQSYVMRVRFQQYQRDAWQEIVDELEPLAERIGHDIALSTIGVQRAFWHVNETGDLSAFERDLIQVAGATEAPSTYVRSALAWAHFYAGRWDDARRINEALATEGAAEGVAGALVALVAAYAGDRDRAMAEIDPLVDGLVSGRIPERATVTIVSIAVEVYLLLGERSKAASLRSRADALVAAGDAGIAWVAEMSAGQAAAADGDWDAAEELFRLARERVDRLPARLALGDAVRWQGWAALERGDASDADRARALTLLAEASAIYGRNGMPRHQAIVDELRRRATVGERAPATERAPAVFRREADYWLLDWQGARARLRDAKGIRHLAVLLASPGREIAALDLASPGAPAERGVGPAVDRRAVAAYRERIRALQDDVDEARACNDGERAARAEIELDALVDALRADMGLGGRARERGAAAERARLSVTKAIKASIERIDAELPPLGRHLRTAVRTGIFCAYDPEGDPPPWQLS